MAHGPLLRVLAGLTEWAHGTLPLFQLLASVATAVAAIAAWRSASAARQTARRADETTRRATEALGRVKEPVLKVDLLADDAFSQEATPMVLRARNDSPHTATDVSITLNRVAGQAVPLSASIAAVIAPRPDGKATYHLGLVTRQMPNPPRDRSLTSIDVDRLGEIASETIYRYVLHFSDDQGFVTWTQQGEIEESVSLHHTLPNSSTLIYDPHRPAYRYTTRQVLPSQVVREANSSGEVGWLRRTWRRVF